jgi:CxxC motif-containing protein
MYTLDRLNPTGYEQAVELLTRAGDSAGDVLVKELTNTIGIDVVATTVDQG